MNRVRSQTDADHIRGQILRGEVDASSNAARMIARRIESQGGFWGPESFDVCMQCKISKHCSCCTCCSRRP